MRESRRGDRAALSELYKLTRPKLYGICLRVLRSEAEAQDALQDVYVTVWRKADRVRSVAGQRDDLAVVLARNRAIDLLRKRRPAETLDAAAEVPDDSRSALEIVEAQQDSAAARPLPRRARRARRGR